MATQKNAIVANLKIYVTDYDKDWCTASVWQKSV